MTRTSAAAALAAILVLAACTTETLTTQTPEPTPPATADATAEASPSPTGSGEATKTAEPTPTASETGGEPGGFTFTANAEADALFLDRFSCQNLEGGYQVSFPAKWNANAEFGEVPPCSWFAPSEYEATGTVGQPPDGVAIEFMTSPGEPTFADGEVRDRAEGFIGVTQSAYRFTLEAEQFTGYYYVVQLGRTFEEGPNLIAHTTTRMGDDFELNRAVLDRMMATVEFIGVIQ